jgi:hypothetical protein
MWACRDSNKWFRGHGVEAEARRGDVPSFLASRVRGRRKGGRRQEERRGASKARWPSP